MNTEKRLLQEVLSDEELAALRQSSLACGLAALRQRRRHRRQLWVAVAVTPLVVLLAIWQFRPPPPHPAVAFNTDPPPPAETRKVKYIDQRELFALFPNRPIALIGPPGHQRFLLLDELPRIEAH
jgi:hypothetical protein